MALITTRAESPSAGGEVADLSSSQNENHRLIFAAPGEAGQREAMAGMGACGEFMCICADCSQKANAESNRLALKSRAQMKTSPGNRC